MIDEAIPMMSVQRCDALSICSYVDSPLGAGLLLCKYSDGQKLLAKLYFFLIVSCFTG